jgi:hypothetical protein
MNASVIAELRAKLVKHMGQERAEQLLREAFLAARLAPKPHYSPEEILAIAETLVARGGYVELLGRSLKVRAFLSGPPGASRAQPSP